MSASIVSYLTKAADPMMQQELRDIFFESSTRKTFSDEVEKELFFQKYLGWYMRRYPEYIWLAQDKKLLGYLVISPTSQDLELEELQPHLKVFGAQIQEFPAHLHINCHRESRGQGIGRSLMETGLGVMRSLNISGIHILTSPQAKNRAFYSGLGFDYEVLLPFNQVPILFMGKKL